MKYVMNFNKDVDGLFLLIETDLKAFYSEWYLNKRPNIYCKFVRPNNKRFSYFEPEIGLCFDELHQKYYEIKAIRSYRSEKLMRCLIEKFWHLI